MELRMLQELGPNGTLEILSCLLGEDGAASLPEEENNPYAPPVNRLRPFVLASFADLQQTWQSTPAEEQWKEVELTARSVPNLPAFQRFLFRATAGRIRAGRFSIQVPEGTAAAELWKGLVNGGMEGMTSPQIASACLSAAEELVEIAEKQIETDREVALSLLSVPLESETTLGKPASGNSPPGEERELGPALLADLLNLGSQFTENLRKVNHEEIPPYLPSPESWQPVLAFAFHLAGRAWTLLGKKEPALKAFSTALELATTPVNPYTWPGWKPPTDLMSRMRLEFLRTVCPAFLSPQEAVPDGDFKDKMDSLDKNRLGSIMVRLLGYQAPLSENNLTDLGWWDKEKKLLACRPRSRTVSHIPVRRTPAFHHCILLASKRYPPSATSRRPWKDCQLGSAPLPILASCLKANRLRGASTAGCACLTYPSMDALKDRTLAVSKTRSGGRKRMLWQSRARAGLSRLEKFPAKRRHPASAAFTSPGRPGTRWSRRGRWLYPSPSPCWRPKLPLRRGIIGQSPSGWIFSSYAC
jgi:hypothetical protein